MRITIGMVALSFATALLLGLSMQANSQALPPNLPTKEQLANDNNLFLEMDPEFGTG
jgi:hypothetical protein